MSYTHVINTEHQYIIQKSPHENTKTIKNKYKRNEKEKVQMEKQKYIKNYFKTIEPYISKLIEQ